MTVIKLPTAVQLQKTCQCSNFTGSNLHLHRRNQWHHLFALKWRFCGLLGGHCREEWALCKRRNSDTVPPQPAEELENGAGWCCCCFRWWVAAVFTSAARCFLWINERQGCLGATRGQRVASQRPVQRIMMSHSNSLDDFSFLASHSWLLLGADYTLLCF